jgi:hypothetical protein
MAWQRQRRAAPAKEIIYMSMDEAQHTWAIENCRIGKPLDCESAYTSMGLIRFVSYEVRIMNYAWTGAAPRAALGQS